VAPTPLKFPTPPHHRAASSKLVNKCILHGVRNEKTYLEKAIIKMEPYKPAIWIHNANLGRGKNIQRALLYEGTPNFLKYNL
jgi:hypothetical protein